MVLITAPGFYPIVFIPVAQAPDDVKSATG
jgi:hypothetical protein